jgi:hypothetical protein
MTTASSSGSRPRSFQFSIATLLIAMVGLGLACAALATPTPFWAGAAFAIALLSIPTSVLIAIHRRGAVRAFAIGFFVFAGGYLACFWLLETHQYKSGSGMEKVLPTTKAIAWLYMHSHAKVTRLVPASPMMGGGMSGMAGGFGGTTPAPAMIPAPYYGYQPFYEATQYILTMLIGLLGGLVARLLYLTAPTTEPPRDSQAPRA